MVRFINLEVKIKLREVDVRQIVFITFSNALLAYKLNFRIIQSVIKAIYNVMLPSLARKL